MNERGTQAVVISTIFCFLATLTVVLRLIARFFLVHHAGLEDYCIALSMVCGIGLTICIGLQASFGMGEHIAKLTPSDMLTSGKAFFASVIVYNTSLGLTKISILLQYLRVFTTKQFRIACYTVLVIVTCYSIWTIVVSVFSCTPVRAFWTHEPGAKCIDQFKLWFTNAGINIVTDLAIVILPMPVLRSLNLAKRQKIILMSVFAVGGCVCIISIMRLQSLVAISNSNDPTYDNPPAATWSSVEISIAIICSSVPTLRPLVSRLFPRFFSSYGGYGRNTGEGTNGAPLATLTGRASRIPSKWQPSRSGSSRVLESRSESAWDPDGVKVDTRIDVQIERVSDDDRDTTRKEKEGSTDTLVLDGRSKYMV